MAWLRIGDNILTHPHMSKLLEACDLDHDKKNKALGVYIALATVSAAHLTDSVVEMGMLAQVAPGNEKAILDALVRSGLAERVLVDDRWMIKLDLDDEEFVHARKRDEVLIDRRRARDKRDDSLQIPVRVRDGDQCRWCGRTVSWTARRGIRAGTIDSLNGHKNSTVDTLVVACHGCNSKRREGGVELELRDPPAEGEAYYTEHTIELVNKNKWAQEMGIHLQPSQTELSLDTVDTTAASSRQHTDSTAADEQSGSSALAAAAPTTTGAPAGTGAPRQTAPGNDPIEEAPDWVTATDAEVKEIWAEQAAAKKRAAPHDPDHDVEAAPSRQQQDDQAAAPAEAAAPADRAAPDESATPTPTPEDNETVKPGTKPSHDPDRLGDESGLVGTGRAGTGSDGQGREANRSSPPRRRRRGKRGGRK